MIDGNGTGNREALLKKRLRALQKICKKQAARIRELERKCAYDPLTGLLKSDGFESCVLERIEKISRKNRSSDTRRGDASSIVVFIDMDRFKQVNDTLGHDAGDEILRIFADIIRDEDLVVRRSGGGDEFLMTLFDIDEDEAGKRLVEMRTQFEAGFLAFLRKKFPELTEEFQASPVSFSFGIEKFPHFADTACLKLALSGAEKKMHESKTVRGMER